MTPHSHILVDTDIGSDIDDALALLLLLHLSGVELVGLTTVYGNTTLRALIARRILEAAGVSVPVVAGEGRPMSSPMPVWHTDVEGLGLLGGEEIASAIAEKVRFGEAANFLVGRVLDCPGEITLVAIGALTNVALALDREPRFGSAVKRLVFMGGGVTYPKPLPDELESGAEYTARPSHNVRCDVEAARRVFQSGMPITVLTNDATTQLWWEGPGVQHLLAAEDPPESAAVGRLLDAWLKYRTRIFGEPIAGTCPHDALTVAEAVYPERFARFVWGFMSVQRDGTTSLRICPDGPHKVAVRVDGERFLTWFGEHVEAKKD